MRLTASRVAELVRGELLAGSVDTVVSGVSIDSRTLSSGELFFAIRGPNFDGHAYVADATSKGALGVVSDRPLELPAGAIGIVVADTTKALQDLSHGVRMDSAARVVAITGSMGKTTSKEAAAVAIESHFSVLKSSGNLNNLFGLPLSLVALDDEEVAVLEMGMSEPGEITRLAQIARPDVGVVVNVAEVHLEYFSSLSAIADAKGELFEALGEGGTAVVNADDPLVLEQARKFSGRQIHFGIETGATLRASAIRPTSEGQRFQVEEGERRVEVRTSLRGRHNVYNLLAGLAAARAIDVPLAEAAGALSRLAPARHRGERLTLPTDVVIIDETYNSNPRAAMCALDALGAERGRRVAVLGDMLELGSESDALHEAVGRHAAAAGVDVVIGVGPLAERIVEGATLAGIDRSDTVTCADAEGAFDAVVPRVAAGDVVLVKGSRSVGLDETVRRLVEHFEGKA